MKVTFQTCALRNGTALLAVGLFSLGSWGCFGSHSPVAPKVVPEPPLGKMVATVNGSPWESKWTRASGGIIGPSDELYIGGFGDNLNITLALPASRPSVGTYRLADGWSNGLVEVLTPTGWIAAYTTSGLTGYATVARVDSTIVGDFYFDAQGGGGGLPLITRVRAGAFNVRIEASSVIASRTAHNAARDR